MLRLGWYTISVSMALAISPTLLSGFTGYVFDNALSSSWPRWRTNSCTIKHQVTSGLSSVLPMYLDVEHSAPATLIAWWCRMSDSHLSATELSRLLNLACGTVCQRSYICSITALLPAASENILVSELSAIFSGRYRDTLLNLPIVFFLLKPI